MPEKSFNEILKDIKEKKTAPIYILQGTEDFFIDELVNEFEDNLLEEHEKGFSQVILYGKETDAKTLASHCRSYSMSFGIQLVILKEAQSMSDFEKMESYFEQPMPSTVFVAALKGEKSLDKRKKIYKLAEKAGVIFNSKAPYDNQIPDWITNHAKNLGLSIDQQAVTLLFEFVGNNLSKLANEIKKLSIVCATTNKISVAEVEKYIGINREYNLFELQKALSNRDTSRSFKIINYFSEDPKASQFSMPFCVSSLYAYFGKVWLYHRLPDKNNAAQELGVSPFFLKDYQAAAKNFSFPATNKVLKVLLEYDLRSKGINNGQTQQDGLLKEMTYKILDC